MLTQFLDRKLVSFSQVESHDWQSAIKKSCEGLTTEGYISSAYADEIIDCVDKYGPYIVIIPGVAMPHSSEGSINVKGTAISLTIFDKDVIFSEDKTARLFFTLAAKNPEEHTENISNLSEMLMTDGLVEDLMTVKNLDDYQMVASKYNI